MKHTTVILAFIVSILSTFAQPTLDDFQIGVTAGPGSFKLLSSQEYDFIEPSTPALFQPNLSDEEFLEHAKKIKTQGVVAPITNSFLHIKVVGPEKKQQAALDYCKLIFSRAKHIGVNKIVFGSQGSRSYPKDYDPEKAYHEFVGFLKRIVPEAKKHNIVICLEPLTSDPIMLTIERAARMCEDVNMPNNLGITADFWHMMNNNDAPENITKFAKHIKHIHLAEKKGRTPPGVSNQDLNIYWEAMIKAGYTGLVSIEGSWPDGYKYKEHGPTALRLVKLGIQNAINKVHNEKETSSTPISPTGYSNKPLGSLKKPLIYNTYTPSLQLSDEVLSNHDTAAPASMYSPEKGTDIDGTREPIHGLPSAIAVNHGKSLSYIWDKTECRLLFTWKDGFLNMTPYWGTEEGGRRTGFGYVPLLDGSVTYLASGAHPLQVNRSPIGKPAFIGYQLHSHVPIFRWSTQGIEITTKIYPTKDGNIRIYYTAPKDAILTYPPSDIVSVLSIEPNRLAVTITPSDFKNIAKRDTKKFTKVSEQWGEHLYTTFGCNTCHSLDGGKSHGPTFHKLADATRDFNGTKVTADAAYLIEAIKAPNAKIVPGYQPNYMPKYALNDQQVESLVRYIQSLNAKD